MYMQYLQQIVLTVFRPWALSFWQCLALRPTLFVVSLPSICHSMAWYRRQYFRPNHELKLQMKMIIVIDHVCVAVEKKIFLRLHLPNSIHLTRSSPLAFWSSNKNVIMPIRYMCPATVSQSWTSRKTQPVRLICCQKMTSRRQTKKIRWLVTQSTYHKTRVVHCKMSQTIDI